MEAEACAILEAVLAAPEEDATDLASFARGLFAPLGGVELPPREPARDPPDFGRGQEARADTGSPSPVEPRPDAAARRRAAPSGKAAATARAGSKGRRR